MYSKAKLLGHPIHPMLVALPVGFYTGTLAAYVANGVTGNHFWFQVGVVANLAGVVGAAIAAIPGLIDLVFGIPNEHPAKAVGVQHMLLNVAALTCFAVDAYLQYGFWDRLDHPIGVAIVFASAGMGLTVVAGFLGWTLVQRHHVGVDMTPERPPVDTVSRGGSNRPPAGTVRHVHGT